MTPSSDWAPPSQTRYVRPCQSHPVPNQYTCLIPVCIPLPASLRAKANLRIGDQCPLILTHSTEEVLITSRGRYSLFRDAILVQELRLASAHATEIDNKATEILLMAGSENSQKLDSVICLLDDPRDSNSTYSSLVEHYGGHQGQVSVLCRVAPLGQHTRVALSTISDVLQIPLMSHFLPCHSFYHY